MSDWLKVQAAYNQGACEYLNVRTNETRVSSNLELMMGSATNGSLIGAAQNVPDWYSQRQQNQINCQQQAVQDVLRLAQQQSQPQKVIYPGKKVTMFGSIKKYLDDHRDLLLTIVVLVLVDSFVFDGAFKEKIKQLIDRVIGHADSKIKALETK